MMGWKSPELCVELCGKESSQKFHCQAAGFLLTYLSKTKFKASKKIIKKR
jgi:hypothetical protein